MTVRQTPPFAVQIELSCGCNLRCPFCGINGIRTKERTYEFMTVETANKIARRLHHEKWPSFRTEFAMHGEPTQNPNAVEIISIFRKYLPDNYFLMETNGSGFLGKDPVVITSKVLSYFDAGLDTIGLDEYQNITWGNTVRLNLLRSALDQRSISYHEYPKDSKGNPHTRTKEKRFTIIAPIDLSKHGTHAELNNHCGSGAPLDTSMVNQRCAKPFRELSILWDGGVSICCNSWDGNYQIGNVADTSVDKIWNHPRFYAARQKLLHKQRDFAPCFGCNNRSYRVGLLPDKFGKDTLPAPDAKTEKIIKDALADGPRITPVDRGWNTDRALLQIAPARSLF